MRAREVARRAIARRSPAIFAFFGLIFERALRKDFEAVRLARETPWPAAETPRLVIYSNHPAWWDAMAYVLLTRRLLGNRPIFSPMDAPMLERYPFMGRMGAFGVRRDHRSGGLDFLAACREIFTKPDNMLFVAVQGGFADARQRPIRMEPGIAHLPDVADGVTYVPLALDYTFWQERRPELLLRFGAPIAGDDLRALPARARHAQLEAALEAAMTALAASAIARDAGAFETLVSSQGGISPVYDTWRRLIALLSGRRFNPKHGSPT